MKFSSGKEISELYDKVPDITGSYVWVKIKRCPVDESIYQDICMDYMCIHMKWGICEHPDIIILKEGYKKT